MNVLDRIAEFEMNTKFSGLGQKKVSNIACPVAHWEDAACGFNLTLQASIAKESAEPLRRIFVQAIAQKSTFSPQGTEHLVGRRLVSEIASA